MGVDKTDFRDIIRKIENKEILLPDFQREFVWRDEEQQKKIVASVLAKMPIGSILLLTSKANEYSSKAIGTKKEIDINSIKDKVHFLLDGQQRITVLTNVFSDVIHNSYVNGKDLLSPSLKRRFFLRIPKWCNCHTERDLFGVYNFEFKYINPDTEDPDFLTNDILPFITVFNFQLNDKNPYNPKVELSTELDDFCKIKDDGYLIPLFLLVPPDNQKQTQVILRYKRILEDISTSICNEIESVYASKIDREEKNEFIDEIFILNEVREKIKQNDKYFRSELDEKAQVWNYHINNYLKSCINQVTLNQIIVSEEQRARAIDIYENLNRGGISLNTFDLIMARVAIVSKDNFYQRIIKNITSTKTYEKAVISENVIGLIYDKINSNKYNASVQTGCYNEKKDVIASRYIDVFLDVLSLYCNNKDLKYDGFKLEYMKRDKILNLDPKEIDQNCETICNAIDRALFFLQNRCGIRNIQEVNYSLIIVLLATVFLNDQWYQSQKIHKFLEAWYWTAIFSGIFDKDQNTNMINNLQTIVRIIENNEDYSWLNKQRDNILNVQYFSDESFLLMEKVSEDRYPKTAMRLFMCQYLLSKTYSDMFNAQKTISVYMQDENKNDTADQLESHHIIPLGSVKRVGESTKALRKDLKHICNSPLNFVLITKESNKEILNAPIDDYIMKITDEAKSKLYISGYSVNSKEDVTELLRSRYKNLKGDIKNHIDILLR